MNDGNLARGLSPDSDLVFVAKVKAKNRCLLEAANRLAIWGCQFALSA